MQGSVSTVSCRALLTACEHLGLDADALVRGAGLDRARLDDPDGRLSPLDVMALWEHAERASGDPHIALAVARSVPRGAYRVIEYLGAAAPTVGVAFEKLVQYFAFIDTSASLRIVRVDNLVGLSLEAPVAPDLVPLRALELTFATSLHEVRDLTGRSFRPERLELAMPRSESAAPLAAFVECPLSFSAGRNCMLFQGETWELESSNADASLLALLDRHAQNLLTSAAPAHSTTEALQRLLRDSGPSLGLAETAKKLGLSERTLQRRLAEEGTVFAEVVSSIREEIARQLLRERKVAIAEAAFLLGFSDQSSFTRSFKRWTGQTPAAFRAASAGGPDVDGRMR